MMKIMGVANNFRVLFTAAVLSAGAWGQVPEKASEAKPPEKVRSPVVEDLIASTRLAAPEMAADTLLKLAASNRVRDVEWRHEIIEEAYRIAGDAKNPVRKSVVRIPGVPMDTRAGYLSLAHDLGLDTLSLRSRAIRQMLAVDKERAKQMVFEMYGRLGLKKVGCEEMHAHDVTAIYGAVAEVAKQAFTKTEIDEGVRAQFLTPWVENIESPAQLAPALTLLTAFADSRSDTDLLFALFSRAIDRNFGDDRSFTHAVEIRGNVDKVIVLTSGVEDQSKSALRTAFRSMLVKNLGSSRCRENELKTSEEDKEKKLLPHYVSYMNRMYREKPVTAEMLDSAEILGQADTHLYWQTANAKKFIQAYRGLRLSEDGRPLEKNARDTIEWQARANIFLESLGQWNASESESEADVFNQKAVLYLGLVKIVPDGAVKRNVLRAFIGYLSNSPMQKESFIEWYFHVRHLRNDDRKAFLEMTRESPDQNFRLLKQIGDNGL